MGDLTTEVAHIFLKRQTCCPPYLNQKTSGKSDKSGCETSGESDKLGCKTSGKSDKLGCKTSGKPDKLDCETSGKLDNLGDFGKKSLSL